MLSVFIWMGIEGVETWKALSEAPLAQRSTLPRRFKLAPGLLDSWTPAPPAERARGRP